MLNKMIACDQDLLDDLQKFKTHPREPNGEVVRKLVDEALFKKDMVNQGVTIIQRSSLEYPEPSNTSVRPKGACPEVQIRSINPSLVKPASSKVLFGPTDDSVKEELYDWKLPPGTKISANPIVSEGLAYQVPNGLTEIQEVSFTVQKPKNKFPDPGENTLRKPTDELKNEEGL
jgi:hypothetical protein